MLRMPVRRLKVWSQSPSSVDLLEPIENAQFADNIAGTAGGLLHRAARLGCAAGGFFVVDDVLQALDAVLGEGGDAVVIDAPDVEAAVLGGTW
jgi:predicted enzyme related to lactoylglutathione lyase